MAGKGKKAKGKAHRKRGKASAKKKGKQRKTSRIAPAPRPPEPEAVSPLRSNQVPSHNKAKILAFLKHELEKGTAPALLSQSLHNANLPERYLFDAMVEADEPEKKPRRRTKLSHTAMVSLALLALVVIFQLYAAALAIFPDTPEELLTARAMLFLIYTPVAVFSALALALGFAKSQEWVCSSGGWLAVFNAAVSLITFHLYGFFLWLVLFVLIWLSEERIAPRPLDIPGITSERV